MPPAASALLTPSFLLGLLGTALLVAAVRGWFFGYPPRGAAMIALTAKEEAIVSACADALFPASGPIPLSGTQAGVVPYLDAQLAALNPEKKLLVRLLFAFVEHGPSIFGPRLTRFTRLNQAERQRVLSHMSTSPIYFRRLSFLSLRTLVCMAYLAHPEVARAIGSTPSQSPFAPAPALS